MGKGELSSKHPHPRQGQTNKRETGKVHGLHSAQASHFKKTRNDRKAAVSSEVDHTQKVLYGEFAIAEARLCLERGMC